MYFDIPKKSKFLCYIIQLYFRISQWYDCVQTSFVQRLDFKQRSVEPSRQYKLIIEDDVMLHQEIAS